MLKHYTLLLFPIILCWNNLYSTDNPDNAKHESIVKKIRQNFVPKSEFFGETQNQNNTNISNYFNINNNITDKNVYHSNYTTIDRLNNIFKKQDNLNNNNNCFIHNKNELFNEIDCNKTVNTNFNNINTSVDNVTYNNSFVGQIHEKNIQTQEIKYDNYSTYSNNSDNNTSGWSTMVSVLQDECRKQQYLLGQKDQEILYLRNQVQYLYQLLYNNNYNTYLHNKNNFYNFKGYNQKPFINRNYKYDRSYSNNQKFNIKLNNKNKYKQTRSFSVNKRDDYPLLCDIIKPQLQELCKISTNNNILNNNVEINKKNNININNKCNQNNINIVNINALDNNNKITLENNNNISSNKYSIKENKKIILNNLNINNIQEDEKEINNSINKYSNLNINIIKYKNSTDEVPSDKIQNNIKKKKHKKNKNCSVFDKDSGLYIIRTEYEKKIKQKQQQNNFNIKTIQENGEKINSISNDHDSVIIINNNNIKEDENIINGNKGLNNNSENQHNINSLNKCNIEEDKKIIDNNNISNSKTNKEEANSNKDNQDNINVINNNSINEDEKKVDININNVQENKKEVNTNIGTNTNFDDIFAKYSNNNNNKKIDDDLATIAEAQTILTDDYDNYEKPGNKKSKNQRKKERKRMKKAKKNEEFYDVFRDIDEENLKTIAKQYKLLKNQIKSLNIGNNEIYNLPIADITKTQENFEQIKEENQQNINKLFNIFVSENYENEMGYAYPVISKLSELETVSKRNIACFMIGKILEIQKYNDEVIKQNIKEIHLLKLSNYDNIINTLQEYSCIINNKIYYTVNLYDKCTENILQKDIFKYQNNQIGAKIIKLLQQNIDIVYKEFTQDVFNFPDVQIKIATTPELMCNMLHNMYYERLMNIILKYSYVLEESVMNSDHHNVIEVFIDQLLYIDKIIYDNNQNIQQKTDKINAMLNNGIDKFMPYITYYKNLILVSHNMRDNNHGKWDGMLQAVNHIIKCSKIYITLNNMTLTRDAINQTIGTFIKLVK